jgi:hypothetical protein
MAVWKHYIVLFGGFHDAGLVSASDVARLIHDVHTYAGRSQPAILTIYGSSTHRNTYGGRLSSERVNLDRRMSFAISSFAAVLTTFVLVVPEVDSPSYRRLRAFCYMVVLCLFLVNFNALTSDKGGYCKEYVKGKRPVGVMLEDTWFLKQVVLQLQACIAITNMFLVCLSQHQPPQHRQRHLPLPHLPANLRTLSPPPHPSSGSNGSAASVEPRSLHQEHGSGVRWRCGLRKEWGSCSAGSRTRIRMRNRL